MSEPGAQVAAASPPGRPAAGEAGVPRRGREEASTRRRRRWLTAAIVAVVIAAAGAATGIIKPFSSPPAAPAARADPTGLQPVTRQPLSEQTTASGTLGYAGDYAVVVPTAGSQPPGDGSQSSAGGQQGDSPSGSAQSGTFTALPAVGRVVRQGQSVYSVSGSPVALLYGAVPAYRSLSEGMTGTDVQQLNADLVMLGDATRSELDPGSGYFGPATATALHKLQASLGLAQTGTLPLGQAVFQPAALLVSSVSATLGEPAQPGGVVLQATSTIRQVVAQVDAAQQSDVTPGAQVSIVLPDNQATPGVVTSVSAQGSAPPDSGPGSSSGSGSSGSSGSQGSSQDTINVGIKMTDPSAAGSLEQAPVQVTITTATANDALAVPVDALITEPGGYDVEVAGPDGSRHIVPVSLGLFDDAAGLVQVTGALTPGQQVVVPAV